MLVIVYSHSLSLFTTVESFYNHNLPLWTGRQVVMSHFIHGAIVVQIQYTSMENLDIVDNNIPTGSTT